MKYELKLKNTDISTIFDFGEFYYQHNLVFKKYVKDDDRDTNKEKLDLLKIIEGDAVFKKFQKLLSYEYKIKIGIQLDSKQLEECEN